MPMLVDSHCHLDFPEFEKDRDDIVTRAMAAGIGYMVTICNHMTKFKGVYKVANTYSNMSCTVGVLPHNAGEEGGLAYLLSTSDPSDASRLLRLRICRSLTKQT